MKTFAHKQFVCRFRPFITTTAVIVLLFVAVPQYVFAQQSQPINPDDPIQTPPQQTTTNAAKDNQSTAGKDLMSIPCADIFAIPSRIDFSCIFGKILNGIADSFLITGAMTLGREAVEGSFNINQWLSSPRTIDFIDVGWPILRDIANIFFIFIFLWIALATIFDLTQYSARALLPRFVIAALLINFSLPIGAAVISLANNFGNVFWGQADDLNGVIRIMSPTMQLAKKLTNPPETVTAVKNAAEKEQQLTELYNKTEIPYFYKGLGQLIPGSGSSLSKGTITGADCEKIRKDALAGKKAADVNIRTAKAEACAKAAGNLWTATDFMNIDQDNGLAIIFIKQGVLKLMLYPPLIFILFATAALMIIRYIMLVFLLALSPMAFLGMILPGTRKWWNEWWDSLIKWSLFFPIFAIFFYISIRTLDALNKKAGGADFMSYLLTIAFILGSLIAAQKIGISAAGTAMAYGKKFGLGAARLAGRGALAPARLGGRELRERYFDKQASKAAQRLRQTAIGGLPGIRHGLEAVDRWSVAKQKERDQRLGRKVKGMSDEMAWERINTTGRPEDARAMIKTLGEERWGKMFNSRSAEEQKTFAEKLRAAGEEGLATNVSNDPRFITEILNPDLRGKEGSAEYKEKMIPILKGMNKQSLSTDFIENADPETMQALNAGDIQQIMSTNKGAASYSNRIKKLNEEMFTKTSAAYQTEFKKTLDKEMGERMDKIGMASSTEEQENIRLEAETVAKEAAKKTAQKVARSLNPFNQETERFMISSPGGQALMGSIRTGSVIPKMAMGGMSKADMKQIEKIFKTIMEEKGEEK